MPFTNEDKLLIKLLHQEKGWGAKRICKEFSNKKWAVSSVGDLLRKIDTTNLISRKTGSGSGRPRTVIMEQNIEHVAELICSQEDNPGSSKSHRDIEKLTGILAVLYNESLRQIFSFKSSDARRRACCVTLIVSGWWCQLKAAVQVHKGHSEQLFTWLLAVRCCYLDIGTSMCCCCVLPLWHNDIGVLSLCCNFLSLFSELIWFGL